jgi:hypothetical protein
MARGDGLLGALTPQRRQLKRLEKRLARLEDEMQEMRQLNRRIAELTDMVQELLVPAADRDDERVKELLQKYEKGL